MRNIRFYVYRYQILPTDRFYEGDLFNQDITSVDELLARKNILFPEALNSLENIIIPRSEGSKLTKIPCKEKDFFVMKISVNRPKKIEQINFKITKTPNWPSFYFNLWNDDQKQYILIEEKEEAFNNTYTFVHLFTEAINLKLKS